MFQRCTQIIRRLHGSCPQMIKRNRTPGAGRQIKALEGEDEFIEDPEGFGNFESDFMRLDVTNRQHEAALEAQREHVRHMVVKRKYFNEQKLPNLLLYAEKNEIRTLHARDSEEWTIEKLAESFPATVETIKKIVNSKWKPYSLKRIRKHDEGVIQNWENLKNGKEDDMCIPSELRQHLMKFAKRTTTLHYSNQDTSEKSDDILIPKLPIPIRSEFSSIVTNPHARNNKKAEKVEKITNNKTANLEDETYLIDKVVDRRKMRLKEFERSEIVLRNDSELNKIRNIETSNEGPNVTPTMSENTAGGTSFVQKYEENEIVVSKEDEQKYEMTPYKDNIYIPRKLWRKGGTYRVYDCYYDDDGEFLYRVPGMTKQTF